MTSQLKKMIAVALIALTAFAAPKKSEAAIGVVSLIGGPAGVPIIIIGASIMVGGTAAVLGTCYVGVKYRDWSSDCPIFVNLTFWPGALLLAEEGNHENKISTQIISTYGADQESADNIADRLYNKALRSSKKISEEEKSGNEGEALVVKTKVSFSAKELKELSSSEFVASQGFKQLVIDYK